MYVYIYIYKNKKTQNDYDKVIQKEKLYYKTWNFLINFEYNRRIEINIRWMNIIIYLE